MRPFADRVAIVTGGASGIGRAIAAELVRRGARVVLADIDGPRCARAAQELGARALELDVTDSASVESAIRKVADEQGRLDYLFNNAGVGLVGEARSMDASHWQRILDVNLRGVVHGVQAAYPLMVTQGSGHIVNTSSIFGLVPSPLSVAYAATKHAVVGLSTSLRAEAKALGVKVSVVCPGFVETPMKDANVYLEVDKATALRENPFRMHSPERTARGVLDGVARNRGVIVLSPEAKLMWQAYRLSPSLYQFAAGFAVRNLRKRVRAD